ncbi:MAG: T9SS type A sorting domain-containing protein [Bacteroidia bacterium]|nr:T9SS type A sorting domain-containing protein [Bacteroidia bacterium]MBP7260222.1 T9SS type A sorting domain-containing protein [Bacteroidia bacterium]MBP9179813.1 T9SS type A sorting domain-containing protein [Bacteroidia bacterium]MBP9723812.1 T9SS type A sorting domain-containing protein [Bacteroidia bacterium]
MKKYLTIICILLFSSCILAQSWHPLGPFNYLFPGDIDARESIGNGAIYDVEVKSNDFNIIYAGSESGGVWKSSNKGQSWQSCDVGFDQIYGIRNIQIEPSLTEVVYVTTQAHRAEDNNSFTGGIYRSTDAGASFQKINSGLGMPIPFGSRISDLVYDRTTSYPNTKLFCVKGTLIGQSTFLPTIYKSVNSGDSWNDVTSTFPNTNIPHFAQIEIDKVNGNTLYFSSKTELWASLDGCATANGWVDLTPYLINSLNLPPGVSIIDMTIRTRNQQGYICVFVQLSNSQVAICYSTTNGLLTWTKAFGPSLLNVISSKLTGGFEVSEKEATTFFIGTDRMIYRIKNNAYEFISFNKVKFSNGQFSQSNVHMDIRALKSKYNSTTNEHIVLCGSDGGVSLCSNPDEICNIDASNGSIINSNLPFVAPVWSYQGNNGLNNLHFYGVSVSLDGSRIAAGAHDCSTFILEKSSNQWIHRNGGDGGDALIYPSDKDIIYAQSFPAITDVTQIHLTNNGQFAVSNTATSILLTSNYDVYGSPGDGTRPMYFHPTSGRFYSGFREVVRVNHSSIPTYLYNMLKISVSDEISQFNPPHSTLNVNNPGIPISAVAVAESDENIIYVGMAFSSNQSPVLYKNSNALGANPATSWVDITTSVPNAQQLGVSDIEVDPNNKDRVFLALRGLRAQSSTIPYNSIYYSVNGGSNWVVIPGQFDNPTDLYTSFPYQEIYCLEYDRVSDRLYAGFQNGIYYFQMSEVNNQNAKWHRFMSTTTGELPAVAIRDIEINYLTNTIYAATFGRGIWESPLPCPVYPAYIMQPTDPAVIANAADINWNYSDYHIPTGYSLTIDNTTIKMPQGGRFTISPGGKLIIKNNAKITNGSSNCAYMWDGIYIQGNTALPQLPNNSTGFYPDQGFLVLENCTLEHAYMAVSVGESTPSSPSNGGVLKADNALFLNNRFSVRFYEYGFSNAGRVNDCVFRCTGSLPYFSNNDGSYSFVSLFGVKNVWLRGNKYENTAPGGLSNPFGSKFRGAGIISVNSTYWVTPSYMNTSSNGTCVFPIAGAGRSVFKGLTHGVYIYNQNNDPTRQAHILEADFEDVSMGIGMNWDTKTQAYGNHFTWTANFDQYPYFSHPNVAVKTDFAEGSSIDRNEMNFSYQDPSSTGFHGVSVFMSNPGLYPIGDPNLLPFNVYKNNILSGNGNLAGEVGLHIDGSHNDGLQFQCNEFSGLGNAVISQVGNNIPPQGSQNMAAGNKFNDPCINNNRLYSPAPTNPTDYFYSSISNEEVASFQCSNWNNIFSPNTNPCPENSRLGYYCPEGESGGGTGEIGENEQHIRNHTDEFSDALRLIQAGAYSSAQALLPQISNEQEHGLVSLSLDVYQGGSSYFTLSPAQKQTLDQLFETGNVKVKQSIRSISLAFTQEPVQETPPVAVTATMLAKREAATVKVTDAGEYKLFPNPAHQHVNLTYRLPSNSTKATIRVQDVFGQVVWQQVVTSHSGQVEINLPQKTGIFFCTIENNERTLFKTKVLLTK